MPSNMRVRIKDDSFCWDEPYTLPENFFLAWQRGAGSRYKDHGPAFPRRQLVLGSACSRRKRASRQARLQPRQRHGQRHAGLFRAGQRKVSCAPRATDSILCATQSFATGGWGPNEEFRKPGSGGVGESLTKTHSSFETPCGSYAHFKITRYLLRTTKDSRYGDSMERVLYNCILGVKQIKEDGHGFYYSDYNNDGSKVYHPYKWHCCTGTFSQIAADYGISSYFGDNEGVYVNLFVPSRVTWKRGTERVGLVQRTDYPHRPTTQIEIATDTSSAFAVFVRIPAWAGPKTTIAVNGKRAASSPTPGQFARIQRTWKKGDRIEVEFDMPTTLQAVDPEHPKLVAAVHGPLALFAVGEIPATVRNEELASVVQVTDGSTNWQAKTVTGNVAMRPFTAINDEHYRLYLNVEA